MRVEVSPAGGERVRDSVERYADMVVRLAFQHTGNQADAEDIAQEVFLKLMRRPAFRDETHRKAWLIRVTVNQSRDLKKTVWHSRVGALPEDVPCPAESRETLLALRTLPEPYRDVLYLYYYEEYTVPEIARLLRKNPNTVRSWLGRARDKMKTMLEED